MKTYTFSFNIIHAETERLSTSEKWFRRTLTWEVEATSEEDARTHLAERIEAGYPASSNYKAINIELAR